MTLQEIIKELQTESCYECAFGCDSPVNCTNDCRYKQAITKAIQLLKECEAVNE